jgi:hypothetical protein
MIETANHVEQRALAAARGTDERDERPGLDREVHVPHGRHVDVTGPVGL